ncbi:NACHT domain-containing protein [Brevundimonas naejangsanensis]
MTAFEIQNENRNPGSALRNEAANYLSGLYGNGRTEILIAGKKVDGVFERDDFGSRETIILEAKDYARPLHRDDLKAIWSDYETVLDEVRPAKLLVISRHGLAPGAQAYLDTRPPMRHRTIWELEDEVLGLRPHTQAMAAAFEEGGLSRFYIEARAAEVAYDADMAESEGEVVGLIDEVVAWLATEDPTPLAILGGYGAGKSSFAKRLVTQQAAQALTDPSARRPILIKLGGLSRYSDLEGFLGAMLTSQHNVRVYNFTRFLDFNSKGRFLIVLDGFDEMKHAMSFSEFRAQVGQFNQLITPGAKVVLLGRPSAFTTDAEHHYVLKGRIPAQDRWRKLPGWPEFREYRLADFSDAERDLFIAGFLAYQAGTSGDGGADAEWVDKRRQEVSELAAADPAVFGRPVHLKILAEMAADREQDLTRLRRSPSRWSLYDEFFQSLARREAEKPARTPIGEKDRLRFLAELAFWLWRDRAAATSFVAEVIPSDLLADLPDGDAHEVEHKRREYLAGAFLERKAGDIYYFPHRSFAEFLVASRMLSCPPQAGDHVLYGTLAQEGVLEFLQTPENQPRLRAWAETFVSAQGSLRPSYIRLLIDAFGGPNPLIQHIPSTYWTLPIRLIGGSLKIDPSNLAPLRTAMMQARVPELALALQLLEPHGVLASEDTVRQALEPMIAGVLIERTLGHVRELPQNDRLSVDGEEGERMRALATAGVKEIAAGRTGRVVSMNWLGLLEGAWAASQAHGVVLKTHAPQQASGYPPLELPLDVVLSTIPVASRPRIQGFLHKLSDLRHIIVVARRNPRTIAADRPIRRP